MPTPSSLSNQMRPPIASTSCLHRYRLKPVAELAHDLWLTCPHEGQENPLTFDGANAAAFVDHVNLNGVAPVGVGDDLDQRRPHTVHDSIAQQVSQDL